MSRSTETLLAALGFALCAAGAHAAPLTNLGRAATPQEIAAWDIDVRPDFKGLPSGSGSVAAGQKVWEARCASCHGTFGESNEVFTPLVGGTDANDIKTGHVASLTSGKQPHKTTLMKLATVSSLWDYINRAMPWTAPKSLSTDEVYAVTAYILNLGEIVPDDFVLSQTTIAEAQRRMPNRNGMSTRHGLWDVRGKPDVASIACMKNCPVEATIRSALPDAARNADGNLALQNRPFGAVRGIDTSMPPSATRVDPNAVRAPATVQDPVLTLMARNACTACHALDAKIIGPSFMAVADKYRGDAGAADRLFAKVRHGGAGNWGATPMPAQSQLRDDEIKTFVAWILNVHH
jgi:cytochrome c551/c552/cytochrome c553